MLWALHCSSCDQYLPCELAKHCQLCPEESELGTLLEMVVYKSLTDVVGWPSAWSPAPEPSFVGVTLADPWGLAFTSYSWCEAMICEYRSKCWACQEETDLSIPLSCKLILRLLSFSLYLLKLLALSVSRRKYFIRKISVLDAMWHPLVSNKAQHKLKTEQIPPGNKEMEAVGYFFSFCRVCVLFQCLDCYWFL